VAEGLPLRDQGRPGFVDRHLWAPYVLVTLTVVFYAITTVLARGLRLEMPPVGLVFWRCSVAVLLLAPFIVPQLRAQLPLLLRHWKLVVLLAITQSVTGQPLLFVGLQTTTALNVGVMTATQPALTMLFAWLLLGEGITRRQAVGLIIAMAGALAITVRGSLAVLLDLDIVIGDVWAQLSIASWALYPVIVKRVPRGINPFVLFLGIMVAAVLCLIPFYGMELLLTPARIEFNAVNITAILYIASLGSILALVCYNVGIVHIGPARASIIFYLMPVFIAAMAIGLLGEEMRPYHLVGFVLVLGGVYLTSLKPRQCRS